ncbi:MAG: 4Fe-4S dicluster domain-containing protein [Deltaproteobacteria bacterium]|nr:4Fe-4S dicluster domain-containing protein [Deltaproteobacteria bacterium]
MKTNSDIEGIDWAFAKETAAASRVDFSVCYQCQKCTNGCPVTFTMDYGPHQIIRMVQLGLVEEISRANTAWVCSSCETCFTRCPQQIDIPRLMDHIKQAVLDRGDRPVEGVVAAFHEAFLDNIRRFGRINETALMAAFQLKSARAGKGLDPKEAMKNLKLGMAMLKRGRLRFVPSKTGGKAAVRKLFDKTV